MNVLSNTIITRVTAVCKPWPLYFTSFKPRFTKHLNLFLLFLALSKQEEINDLKEAIEPPESILDKQRDAHGYFVEKAAWVKQMLAL